MYRQLCFSRLSGGILVLLMMAISVSEWEDAIQFLKYQLEFARNN